jgi:FkbM family methyltransferase
MRKLLRNFIDHYFPALGYKFRLYRDDIFGLKKIKTEFDFWMMGTTNYRKYESTEADLFLRLIGESDVVIDVGANFGFYSLLASIKGKKVYCIEPSPRNLKILQKNIIINKCNNINIYPFGLASESGMMKIYGYSGTSSFVKGWGATNYFTTVSVETLDSLLFDILINKKILIKIDVEGFEVEVLRGAIKFLNMNPAPTWMIEVMLSGELIPGGVNPNFVTLFDLFWEFGYKCRCINSDDLKVDFSIVNEWVDSGRVSNDCHDFLFYKD